MPTGFCIWALHTAVHFQSPIRTETKDHVLFFDLVYLWCSRSDLLDHTHIHKKEKISWIELTHTEFSWSTIHLGKAIPKLIAEIQNTMWDIIIKLIIAIYYTTMKPTSLCALTCLHQFYLHLHLTRFNVLQVNLCINCCVLFGNLLVLFGNLFIILFIYLHMW